MSDGRAPSDPPRAQRRLDGKLAVGRFTVDRLRLGLAVAFFLALAVMLSFDLVPIRFLGVRVGQPAVRTIVAPGDVRVTDAFATRVRREEAAAAVEPQYRLDPGSVDRVVGRIDGFFSKAGSISAASGLSRAERIDALQAAAPSGASTSALPGALSLSAARLDELALETRRLVSVLLVGRITTSELDQVRTAVAGAAAALRLPAGERALVQAIGQAALEPTYVRDDAAETELRRSAAAAVPAVVLSRQKGEVVVRQGEVVTRAHLLLLQALGLTRSRFDVSRFVGVAALIAAMMGVALPYLWRVAPEVYRSTRLMTVLALVTLGSAVAAKLVFAVSAAVPFTVVPVAVAPMLATLLIGTEVGLVTAVGASIVFAMSAQFSAEALVWSLLSCALSVYATSAVTRRSGFYRAGTSVTAFSAGAALAVWLFSGASARESLLAAGYGLVGGVLGSVLTVGSIPFFESLFKITTDLKLADLMSPTQALLRELTRNAPGTYNHSVIVGNLAEAAAEEIGANPTLARAGAYYHDIGKLKRPSFFVENQIGGAPNPHDHTNPRLSSLVIAAHVKDGVELAEKAGLPRELIDIVKQHHGTSVVGYFYQRAVEQEGYHAVDEADFRYQGAKPQSKEAGVVMLADGTEAVVRTLAKPTPQRIEAAARKIIQAKADDGQLDESHLTMCELDTVAKAFTAALGGMYHGRVEYPDGGRPEHGAREQPGSSAGPPVG